MMDVVWFAIGFGVGFIAAFELLLRVIRLPNSEVWQKLLRHRYGVESS